MQPTFVDFEVFPPHDHGVLLDDLTGSEFAGDHTALRPGGHAVLGGFTVTAAAGEPLLVTVRGHADPTARDVPVELRVNGTLFTRFAAIPAVGAPIEMAFAIPPGLTTRERDLLSLHVDTAADGAFHLFHVLVDDPAAPGVSERERRAVAESGSLLVFGTAAGAPGAQEDTATAKSGIWLRIKGEGRAGLAALEWRLADGERVSVAFGRDQRSFTGFRAGVPAADGSDRGPEAFHGESRGIRNLKRKFPDTGATRTFDTQLLGPDGWQDADRMTVHVEQDHSDAAVTDLSWTDWNGARTAIAFTAGGSAFFGRYQRAGGESQAYRGRAVGARGRFPFEGGPASVADADPKAAFAGARPVN